MSESRRSDRPSSDTVGLLLFSVGAFFSVLAIMAIVKGIPQDGGSGTMAIARVVVGFMGKFPALLLAAGITGCGAAMFLTSRLVDPWRHLAGVCGVALGLAVLLGTTGAGGGLGSATAGLVARNLHPLVGFVLGISVLALPVWFIWVRQHTDEITKLLAGSSLPSIPERPADGVSAEEAAALIPDVDAAQAIAQQAFEEDGWGPSSRVLSSSPYPEDVRLKGEIPEGATPIPSQFVRSAATATADGDGGGRSWSPSTPGSSEEQADADVAPAEIAASATKAPAIRGDVFPEGMQTEAAVEPPAAAPVEQATPDTYTIPAAPAPVPVAEQPVAEPIAAPAETAEPEPVRAEEEPVATPEVHTEQETSTPASPPRPPWEQNDLFEEEEDPVDAYGTPQDLRESLANAGGWLAGALQKTQEIEEKRKTDTPAAEVAPVAPDAEVRAEEPPEVSAEEPVQEPEPIVAQAEVTTPATAEVEEEDVEEEEDEVEDVVGDVEASDDEESEEEEDEEYEYVYEDEEEEDPSAETEEEEEEEEYEDEEEEEEGEEGEYEEYDEDEEEEGEEEEDGEEYEYVYEDEEEELEPAAEAGSEEAEEDEEDEEDETVTAEADADDTEASDSTEDVVLKPQAPPNGKKNVSLAHTGAEKADEERLAADDGLEQESQLVFDSGCLFLEEGRVAVSLLQRQFNLEFDKACKVLDRLQTMGLIGPYLGGQRRDILLTLDEWMEKVTAP